MNEIKYVIGDATNPIGNGTKIICHVCNNKGGWGRGFVLALSAKWDLPENSYRTWYSLCNPNVIDRYKTVDMPPFELGRVQMVEVDDDLYVANMIAQHDTVPIKDIPPIRYDRLRQCLQKVSELAQLRNASVHMPRIGAGLAGGSWQVVEGLIKETLIADNIDVTVYDLEE